jgi:hypothetical protein
LLDTIPAVGKLSQGGPQTDTEKRSQEMCGAKALSVSLTEIRNIDKFYREGDDANPDDVWPSFFRIEPSDQQVSGFKRHGGATLEAGWRSNGSPISRRVVAAQMELTQPLDGGAAPF